MILAIDVGNTNIVAGCCDGDRILLMERFNTDHDATSLEYAMYIKAVLELSDIKKESITGAVISSVVPSVTDTIKAAVKKLTGIDALVVGPGIKTGLAIRPITPRSSAATLSSALLRELQGTARRL